MAPEAQHEPHSLCKNNKNRDSTTQADGENEIFQSEVHQKLPIVDKESSIMWVFEDNHCPVCRNNYKDVITNNHHIVVPTCEHTLCCECTDRILVSKKKECPRCIGNITADLLNLIKFNADLEIVTRDLKVLF